jgi:uncharacterized membrane protein
MKIENPFKLQNWKFKKFMLVILSIQISLLGLFGLNNIGIDTSILRPLVGFVYLSFVPGYLLLRILKLHKLDGIESLSYALGLSIFVAMFAGFFANMIYPKFGIVKPISEFPIVITLSGIVFLLCLVAYFVNRNKYLPDYIDLKDLSTPQFLFLSLIPFMAVFGTYLVKYYQNNILLMIMIPILALIIFIIGYYDTVIPEKLYPYAIWVIAISLLLEMSLITTYFPTGDSEIFMANEVIGNGYWDYNVPYNHYSILSTKILLPIIYFICNINLDWAYKTIIPLWISILPMLVYNISLNYLSNKQAFFASCIYITSNTLGYVYIFLLTMRQFLAVFYLC